ncbi:MAG: AAA family ATPase [Terriglobales bacterium]
MSERLKRRKKPGEGTSKEAAKAPEPLQPRFYDDEPAAPAEVAAAVPVVAPAEVPAAPVREMRRVARAEPEVAAEAPPAAAEGSAAGEPRPRVSRRRRSRGSRGGNRGRSAGSPASAVAAAEPSTAEPVTVTAESAAAVKIPSLPVSTVSGEALSGQAVPGQAVSGQAGSAQGVAAPVRASKGTVVLAIGLPGSGKSSWFKRHNIHPLSSDLLRELLFDDAQEQRFQDLVFSNLRSMLKARLIARRPMNYVDATNLTPHDRHSWIKLAKDYGYDVQGVFFDVPLEVCLERHQRRGRAVPEDIMRKMAGKLKPPTFEEGFSKITVVRVKQREASG